MPSEPNDRDRFYQPADIEKLTAYVDDEGVRLSHREALVSCLSWTLNRLSNTDDPNDVAALEGQIMALRHVLDGGSVA